MMLPDTASSPVTGRQRRRRWFIGATCIAVLVWMLTPYLLQTVVEQHLSKRLATPVEVGEVELVLLTPGVVVRDTAFSLDEHATVELPEVAVEWSWRSMLRAAPSVAVRGPRVRIHVVPGARTRRSSRSSSDALTRFGSLRVVGGSLHASLETEARRIDFEISDIAAELRNTAQRASEQTTHFELSGRIGDSGHLEARGSTAPVQPEENWSVDFHIDDVDMVPLNPLWNALVEMDASAGALSLRGEVSHSRGRLRGRIEPNFTNLRLLGEGEKARHPMGEALFSEMLSGASNAMTFDRPSTAGRGDLLMDLLATDWETVIEGVIRRGYQRQLDTLDGYVSRIGAVEVAFHRGHLVLHDVSIARDTGLVPTPFIAVKALEVTFDETVREPGTESFKHVVLREPVLTFVAHEKESRSQMRFDPVWPEKVSSLPFQTKELRVENGTIRFVEQRGTEVNEIAIEEVTLVGRRMARVLSAPGQREASIEASGLALGATPVATTVRYEPASVQGNSHFELTVGALPLTKLNPLARTHAEFDSSSGTVALDAVFDVRGGRVAAAVELAVDHVQIIGKDERHIEHPLREFMLERRIRDLDGKRLEVEFSRDFESGLLMQVAMKLLGEVMRGS